MDDNICPKRFKGDSEQGFVERDLSENLTNNDYEQHLTINDLHDDALVAVLRHCRSDLIGFITLAKVNSQWSYCVDQLFNEINWIEVVWQRESRYSLDDTKFESKFKIKLLFHEKDREGTMKRQKKGRQSMKEKQQKRDRFFDFEMLKQMLPKFKSLRKLVIRLEALNDDTLDKELSICNFLAQFAESIETVTLELCYVNVSFLPFIADSFSKSVTELSTILTGCFNRSIDIKATLMSSLQNFVRLKTIDLALDGRINNVSPGNWSEAICGCGFDGEIVQALPNVTSFRFRETDGAYFKSDTMVNWLCFSTCQNPFQSLNITITLLKKNNFNDMFIDSISNFTSLKSLRIHFRGRGNLSSLDGLRKIGFKCNRLEKLMLTVDNKIDSSFVLEIIDAVGQFQSIKELKLVIRAHLPKMLSNAVSLSALKNCTKLVKVYLEINLRNNVSGAPVFCDLREGLPFVKDLAISFSNRNLSELKNLAHLKKLKLSRGDLKGQTGFIDFCIDTEETLVSNSTSLEGDGIVEVFKTCPNLYLMTFTSTLPSLKMQAWHQFINRLQDLAKADCKRLIWFKMMSPRDFLNPRLVPSVLSRNLKITYSDLLTLCRRLHCGV